MNEDSRSKPAKTTHRIRGFTRYVARLIVAFLLGFGPMWFKSRERSNSLAAAKRQLGLARMLNSLGSAAIDARRGDFETARLAASDFFTLLRAETDKGVESALSQAQKGGAQPLFVLRDQTITLLSRGEVASVDLLSDLYVEFRKLANP